MGLEKGKLQSLVYQYDFAVDGGAISAIPLSPASAEGKLSALAEGFVITNWSLAVETAITSGGTPTMTLGPTSDVDGYAADVFALVGTDNLMVNRGAVAGALVWDDTNDHVIHVRVGSASNTQDLLLTIAVATVTAGKFKFYLHGYQDFS